MKKLIAVSICLVVFASLTLADDANVSGSWKITSQSPRGERTQTVVIEQDGSNITVTSQNRRGETSTSEGTIKGNEISWKVTRETPRGTFEITYTGTVDGDTMSGKVTMGDRGSVDWTAKRVKENESEKASKVA